MTITEGFIDNEITELTPLTALATAELSLQAGIPPGVVNGVTGNAKEIGDTLLASTQVSKITFTGSTAVGRIFMAGAASTVKKVSLELGGNTLCIVFDDADIEVAVKGPVSEAVSRVLKRSILYQIYTPFLRS